MQHELFVLGVICQQLWGCFKMEDQNRFIIMLNSRKGGQSAAGYQSKQVPVAATCSDIVLRNMYVGAVSGMRDVKGHANPLEANKVVPFMWISVPGSPLRREHLEKIRSMGKWWKFIADAAEKEYGNHLGNASNDFKHLQDRMQEERARAAKLCRQSVTRTLTREQSLALHDDLITAFLSEDFQKNLAAHWAAAKGNKAKEQKAKRELCLPLQLPVMEKYGFEKSEKGVFMCLWSVRTTFFNFANPDEVDQEMWLKATFLDFLVSPDKELFWEFDEYVRSVFPDTYERVRKIRAMHCFPPTCQWLSCINWWIIRRDPSWVLYLHPSQTIWTILCWQSFAESTVLF